MDTISVLKIAALGALGIALLWLIWNGWRTDSVWVRGVRKANSSDPRLWASPVGRADNPAGYWLAMCFYTVGVILVLWAVTQVT